MKLVRFGSPGHERPGLWLEDRGQPELLDVRAMAHDIEDYNATFFARHGIERLRGLLGEERQPRLPAAGVRLGPPVARPAQLICVGKNYADHAAEFDAKIPETPLFFAKAVSSLIGPEDAIVLPDSCPEADAEAELAVVIGRPLKNAVEARALEAVAGYCALNDVTDRALQRAAGQWFLGKSSDTFCPLGPWLVTPDETGDPQNLRVASRRNGEPLQEGRSSTMIFSIARLLAALSARITLQPGDILATGTPAGVGFARTPPVLLRPGDIIEVEVERLGILRNPIVRA